MASRAIDPRVQGLRADLLEQGVLAEGADEWMDGCPAGGDRVGQGEEEILGAESVTDPLHAAGSVGETVEFGGGRGPEFGGGRQTAF